MEITQAIDLINACATGHKHPYYNYVVDLANTYKQIASLDNQQELVLSYKPSEDETQRKQRLKIYKSKTPSVTNRIMSQFDFIKGAPRLVDNIEYIDGDNQDATAALNKSVSNFYGSQTLQQYLEEKQKHYSLYDPNAWLILSPVVDGGNIVTASPIIAESADVLDYQQTGGLTKYIVVREKIEKKGEKDITNYFVYSGGFVFYAAEKTKQDLPDIQPAENALIDGSKYFIYVYDTGAKQTPAIRFGYIPDDRTKGETFVGIIEPVVEDFKDLVNQKSEYDLSLALHTFLKKYQIVDPCDYQTSPANRCKNGILYPSNDTCPSCKGSGYKMHVSVQDAILVKRDHEEDQKIKLSEMIHYATMPFDIVNHQATRVDKLANEIPMYIFGVDINTRPTGSVTATEINNFYNSIYMVISPFAQQISENYIFTVKIMAQMIGIDEGLVVSHRYPKNFKMETMSELLIILESAKRANASPDIVWGIEQRILELQNKDNPEQIALAKLKRKFRPFSSLSDQERVMALAELPSNDVNKVLYANIDKIIRAAIQQQFNLLDLSEEQQERIILAVAADYAKQYTPLFTE
jgi:hypothetical protein